jgi:outer membrane usher protein
MGKPKYNLILLALLLIVRPAHASANAVPGAEHNEEVQQDAILGLWINGIDQQQDAVLTVVDQKKYIECNVLQANFMDIAKFQQINQMGIPYCLISEADINVVEDIDSQLLKVNIPTHYMQGQHIQNAEMQLPELPGLGGFLNYDAFYQQGDYSRQANVVADLGLFWKNTFFNHSHIFRKNYQNSDDENFQNSTRLNTSLIFEFPKKLTTLQLGDNVSTNTGLSQSYYFSGFRWGTNFTSRPDFVYWNTPSFKGSALVPSTIDLIINGNKAYNSKINPGEFNIDSNINFRGLGSAEMVVQDIMGNKKVQNIPIFVSERLLKQGLTDYSLSSGKLRYNYSEQSDDYREWFGSAYYRRGITDKTTLGTVMDYSHDLKSTGLLWSQYLYKLGLFELNSAYSHAEKGDGYTVSTEFKRDKEKYSLGLKTQYYSPKFLMLGMEDLQDQFLPERESLIYISKSGIPVLGNLSFSYVEQNYRKATERDDQRIFTLRSSRSLFDNLSMSVGFSYDAGAQKDHRVDLSLSYRFDDKHAAYFNQTDSDSSNLTFVKNTSQAVGVDYAIGAGRANEQNTGNVATRIKTQVGDLDLQYLQTGNNNSYSATFQGALTWLGRSMDLTKSVNNGFSLVKVTDSPEVDVYRNDLFIGRTNKYGEIFVHDLIAYTNQHLSFNENQLQIEDKVSTSRKTIMPLNRRGYIVEFPVVHTREASFKLVNAQGQSLAQGSQVTVDGNKEDIYPITSDDIVTIYGLTNGQHRLDVQISATESCQVTLDLTADEFSDTSRTLVCK